MRVLNDWLPFEVGARILVHWHQLKVWSTPALHLYADNPHIQIGPPPLLLLAPFEYFSPHIVALCFGLAMCAAGVGVVASLEQCAKLLAPRLAGRKTGLTTWAVEAAFVAIWCKEVGHWHHLDDVMALLAISAAMWACGSRAPWWLVGVLLGTGIAAKPWAIVALPIVFGVPHRRRRECAAVAIATAAAWWAPFVIAAPQTVHSLSTYRIFPDPGSLLRLLGFHENVAGWLRPLQLGLGLAVAAWVALRRHWTAAPLAGLAVRALLDPYSYSYYALGPLTAALAWDLTRDQSRVPLWTALTVACWYGPLLAGSPTGIAIVKSALCLATIGFLACKTPPNGRHQSSLLPTPIG